MPSDAATAAFMSQLAGFSRDNTSRDIAAAGERAATDRTALSGAFGLMGQSMANQGALERANVAEKGANYRADVSRLSAREVQELVNEGRQNEIAALAREQRLTLQLSTDLSIQSEIAGAMTQIERELMDGAAPDEARLLLSNPATYRQMLGSVDASKNLMSALTMNINEGANFQSFAENLVGLRRNLSNLITRQDTFAQMADKMADVAAAKLGEAIQANPALATDPSAAMATVRNILLDTSQPWFKSPMGAQMHLYLSGILPDPANNGTSNTPLAAQAADTTGLGPLGATYATMFLEHASDKMAERMATSASDAKPLPGQTVEGNVNNAWQNIRGTLGLAAIQSSAFGNDHNVAPEIIKGLDQVLTGNPQTGEIIDRAALARVYAEAKVKAYGSAEAAARASGLDDPLAPGRAGQLSLLNQAGATVQATMPPALDAAKNRMLQSQYAAQAGANVDFQTLQNTLALGAHNDMMAYRIGRLTAMKNFRLRMNDPRMQDPASMAAIEKNWQEAYDAIDKNGYSKPLAAVAREQWRALDTKYKAAAPKAPAPVQGPPASLAGPDQSPTSQPAQQGQAPQATPPAPASQPAQAGQAFQLSNLPNGLPSNRQIMDPRYSPQERQGMADQRRQSYNQRTGNNVYRPEDQVQTPSATEGIQQQYTPIGALARMPAAAASDMAQGAWKMFNTEKPEPVGPISAGKGTASGPITINIGR